MAGRTPCSSEEFERAIHLAKRGWTIRAIGNELGRSQSFVWKALARARAENRVAPLPHGNEKWTLDKDIALVAELRAIREREASESKMDAWRNTGGNWDNG
jgi:hypothetical protein